jgi:uncharacterized protein (TIGR02217 family)
VIIDNVRLPTNVEKGVRGGPQFNTTVVRTDGGLTSTNQNWAYPLYRGQVAYAIQTREDLEEVIEFFWARRGRMYGFLFKDWSDYTFTTETLGTGDGVEDQFQVIRTYSDTVRPFSRPLFHPIEDTMTVYLNGVAQAGSAWSLLSGGIVDFSTPPGAGVVVTASGEFNIGVQFDTDVLETEMTLYNVGSIPSLPIMEIRE